MLRRIKQELKEAKTLLQFGFLKATGRVLGMITPLVVAGFFSENLFASYKLARMVMFFFVSLLIASTQTPFIIFANQEKTQTGKINKSFTIQCIFLAFSIAAFLLLSTIFSKVITAYAQVSRTDIPFIYLAFFGLALKTFLCNLFLAMDQRLKNSVAELVSGGLTLSILFTFYLAGMISLKTVFLVDFISSLLVIILFVRLIDFHPLFPYNFDWQHFKGMFNFAKWIILGVTAVYFIAWGDNLVLRFFVVPMNVIGEYNLGYDIFKGVNILIVILSTYFLPFISQHTENSAKMKDYLFNKRPKIFLLGFVGIALLFFITPYIFRLFYADTYQSSPTILRILLIASVPTLYNIFYTPILNALKKYKFLHISFTVQLLLNVLLNLLLVPKMGAKGAAVATVIAYFYQAVITEVYFRVKLKKLLDLR